MGLIAAIGFSQASTLLTGEYPDMGLDYYLPADDFLPGIPTPKSAIGHQVGDWHLSHDKLSSYLRELADASERIVYQEYARSYENRPLFHLIITSPENHARLENIRLEHMKLSDPEQSAGVGLEDMPVVLTLGYGVHGNESSGPNSSVLVAYYLAASTSDEVSAYLENIIILLDPSLNPDGFNRHASWINMHKSVVPMKDDNSRGFNETWPGGRTNHYWFDLNRDWILLQHPESRGRVEVFHNWKPNVQTDHHEMGSSSTFFFQPGIPSRTNPFTPQSTTDLTRKIGQYHAEALDGIGSLFFTEEIFDDFYYGKGSSYPDVNGSIGILFEQAGTRGFERITPLGELSFPFAIRNQVKVSLSSVKASYELRPELLSHQRSFYQESRNLYERSSEKAYVFGENGDASSLAHLVDVLLQHKIEVYKLKKSLTLEGHSFSPAGSYVVPLNQPQYRLVQSMFQPVLTFTDSLFYDISAWTFPHAYNVPYAAIRDSKSVGGLTGVQVLGVSTRTTDNADIPWPKGTIEGEPGGIGYIFPWNDYYAPRALYAIQEAGLLTQVATQSFGYRNSQVNQSFGYGSIFIPVQKQETGSKEIHQQLMRIAEETGVSIFPLGTSYTTEGMDMGSRRFVPLQKPKILLLTGEGIRSLEAGEIWHLLDVRMNMPAVLVSIEQLNSMDLSGYTHLIMPSGSYQGINSSGKTEIERWLKRGGTIIAINSANQWLAGNKLANIKFKDLKADSTGFKLYSDLSLERGAQRISGSIFMADIDISHPIGYGLTRNTIPLFRNSTLIAEPVTNPYAAPVRYTADPLLSGYVPEKKYDALREAPGVIISSLGSGTIISFVDNPNFRGIWFGTNKLFMNAIFFAPVISSYSTR